MLDLISIGAQVAEQRKKLKLSQTGLARKAGISRATLDALENRRAGELGFAKLGKLLAALGLEPVSYTHLDVYKRQRLDRLASIFRAGRASSPIAEDTSS